MKLYFLVEYAFLIALVFKTKNLLNLQVMLNKSSLFVHRSGLRLNDLPRFCQDRMDCFIRSSGYVNIVWISLSSGQSPIFLQFDSRSYCLLQN